MAGMQAGGPSLVGGWAASLHLTFAIHPCRLSQEKPQLPSSKRRLTELGVTTASMFFGLMYLCLHGLWRDAGGFHSRLASAALAVFFMA
jgi:hypothetical protein